MTTDEKIEAADIAHRNKMAASTGALLKAIKGDKGEAWPCGHEKTWRNTQTVAGASRCRECRRRRWDEGFYKIARRKQVEQLVEIASKTRIAEPKKKKMWPDWYNPNGRVFFAKDLIKMVAADMGFEPAEIEGRGRSRGIVWARCIIGRILRERGWSYPQIARAVGKKDHTTAMYWVEQFDVYARHNPEVLDCYMKRREMFR